MRRVFVGITGASGSLYAERLLIALTDAGVDVDLCVSPSGVKVLAHELGVAFDEAPERAPAALRAWLGERAQHVRVHAYDAIESPPSSGSAGIGAIVLCPCSMGTLARVTSGYSSNLIERAADVALKEGRPLLLVPRETPLSEIHLENMLRMARLGAILLPAMPGFYHRPTGLDELVDQLVGKVLDRLRIESGVTRRWTGPDEPPADAGTEGATRAGGDS